MMQPLPEDTTADVTEEYALHGVDPYLYPIYPAADTTPKRNEFIYYFPDNQFKVVLGPVERSDGWVWRVELHPDSTRNNDVPELFPTFETAFQSAEEHADCRLN